MHVLSLYGVRSTLVLDWTGACLDVPPPRLLTVIDPVRIPPTRRASGFNSARLLLHSTVAWRFHTFPEVSSIFRGWGTPPAPTNKLLTVRRQPTYCRGFACVCVCAFVKDAWSVQRPLSHCITSRSHTRFQPPSRPSQHLPKTTSALILPKLRRRLSDFLR